MQTIKFGNNKREVFEKNFRTHIFYALVLSDDSNTKSIIDALEEMGYAKGQDSIHHSADASMSVELVEGNLSLLFDPAKSHKDNRIADALRLVDALGAKNVELNPTAISIAHSNRYLLPSFADSKENRENAIDFFFRNMNGDTQGININDDYASVLKIDFNTSEKEDITLDFIVASSIYKLKGKVDVSKGQFENLEDNCYRLWRSVVSNAVLKEMREKNNG